MLARELQRALPRASGYHANDETLGREDTLPPSAVGPLYVRGLWLVAGPGPTFLQVHDGVLGNVYSGDQPRHGVNVLTQAGCVVHRHLLHRAVVHLDAVHEPKQRSADYGEGAVVVRVASEENPSRHRAWKSGGRKTLGRTRQATVEAAEEARRP